MSSNESKKTKQKLKQHKQDFKAILNDAQNQVDEFRKKLYDEIVRLDEEDKKDMQKYNNRKRMLTYKSQVAAQYIEEANDSQYVPVDGQLKSGSMVFMKNCFGCHSLQPIDPKPTHGPSLGLIFNRRVGSNASYMTYSKQMLSANFFWSGRNLYNFMANTRSVIPKTNCKLSTNPITSQADRADLISLFKQFTEQTKFNVRWKEIQLRGYDSFQSNLHSAKQQALRGNIREKMNQQKDKAL